MMDERTSIAIVIPKERNVKEGLYYLRKLGTYHGAQQAVQYRRLAAEHELRQHARRAAGLAIRRGARGRQQQRRVLRSLLILSIQRHICSSWCVNWMSHAHTVGS